MNRHHYALFIRNCHLVLLLRQEPSDASLASELRPAEWRWDIPQVCDNKWHHYAVSVESMEVSSAGVLFRPMYCYWLTLLSVCLSVCAKAPTHSDVTGWPQTWKTWSTQGFL